MRGVVQRVIFLIVLASAIKPDVAKKCSHNVYCMTTCCLVKPSLGNDENEGICGKYRKVGEECLIKKSNENLPPPGKEWMCDCDFGMVCKSYEELPSNPNHNPITGYERGFKMCHY
ncbi:unnamed protein product [Owenia fusiformis]|uniref:Uncharacterized protein n=1 Tax=Owenia fusiformis TaxID=6347 RepID=A0A8S4PAC7_OWEFU|nr:unnamed protein product [Owenia fusiformis]